MLRKNLIQWITVIVCCFSAMAFIADVQAAYAIDRRTIDGVALFIIGTALGAIIGYTEWKSKPKK